MQKELSSKQDDTQTLRHLSTEQEECFRYYLKGKYQDELSPID